MNKENKDWTKGTNVRTKNLICECGREMNIFHSSNWHDGKGIFYANCQSCLKTRNVVWRYGRAAKLQQRLMRSIQFVRLYDWYHATKQRLQGRYL